MTNPTDEERKKLENDLLPIVGMLPFLERGRTLNPEMYPELVGYILNNFVSKAQATPKPAVPEEELEKLLKQRLPHTPEADRKLLAYEITQLFASQATAAQEREYRRGYAAGNAAAHRSDHPVEVVQVPWGAKTGFWNGDMFGDWLNGEAPRNESDHRLWKFLRQFKASTERQAVKEYRKRLEQLASLPQEGKEQDNG